MSNKESIEKLEDRVSVVEAKLIVMDDHDLTSRLSRLEMAYLYVKATFVIVPMVASVLVFLGWFIDGRNKVSEHPPMVDAACDVCLYDFLAESWECADCVVIEEIESGQAVCFDLHDVAGTPASRALPAARETGLRDAGVDSDGVQDSDAGPDAGVFDGGQP